MNADLRPEHPDDVEDHGTTNSTDRVDVVEGPVGSASIKPLEEARAPSLDPDALPAIDVDETERGTR
jgi:hypothetical protein